MRECYSRPSRISGREINEKGLRVARGYNGGLQIESGGLKETGLLYSIGTKFTQKPLHRGAGKERTGNYQLSNSTES